MHVLPKGLPSHPPLRPARQRQARRQHRPRPRAARRAAGKQPETPKAANDEPRAAAASLPLLRWPHDHHRALRARLRPQAPASAAPQDQDRHLMMSSRRSQLYCPCHRWLPAGRDQTCIASGFARIGAANPVEQRSDRSFTPMRAPAVCANPPRQPLLANPASLAPRLNPHSARRTAGCTTYRDFVPWRFSDAGHRSAWLDRRLPASENLHKTRQHLVC